MGPHALAQFFTHYRLAVAKPHSRDKVQQIYWHKLKVLYVKTVGLYISPRETFMGTSAYFAATEIPTAIVQVNSNQNIKTSHY
ncbi:hypothetical protein QG37_04512 [Candidozyma auris]|uniref:Uncharacterized protein n=1 Tax=Candidozyma auris TaxID=498019 RepID=A0A0L0NY74_CANAR|nr:hypothetical protein QG37_04512 [[Candida] auris]